MANVPFGGFAQGYTKNLAATYDPVIQNLSKYIQGLQTRGQNAPGEIAGLFAPAMQQAQNVGGNVATTGANLFSALAGVGGSLPGVDPTELALAARQTGRAGATGAMLGSVLGTQVGQEQALAVQQAQARLADEQAKAQIDLAKTQQQQASTAADWMPYAQQRQQMVSTTLSNQAARAQLAQIPIQNRAAALANMAAQGQIDAQILNNLDAMKKLGLSQADIVKARKLYGGVRARGGTSGSTGGGTGGGTTSTSQPSM